MFFSVLQTSQLHLIIVNICNIKLIFDISCYLFYLLLPTVYATVINNLYYYFLNYLFKLIFIIIVIVINLIQFAPKQQNAKHSSLKSLGLLFNKLVLVAREIVRECSQDTPCRHYNNNYYYCYLF